MSEIADWFKNLPTFTRYWFGISVVLPVACRFRLIAPYWMGFDYTLVFKQLEVSNATVSSIRCISQLYVFRSKSRVAHPD